MITVTGAQAAAIFAIVELTKTGLITWAQYHANLTKVMNMRDAELNAAIQDENVDSDLLMQELDKI